MTPELTKKLDRIKAACRKVLELDANATPSPWELENCYVNAETGWAVAEAYEPQDAAFIAFARSITPDMAKFVIFVIEQAIEQHERAEEENDQDAIRWSALYLQQLADSFQETSLP